MALVLFESLERHAHPLGLVRLTDLPDLINERFVAIEADVDNLQGAVEGLGAEELHGLIASPLAVSYTLIQDAGHASSVLSITAKVSVGGCTLALRIDGALLAAGVISTTETTIAYNSASLGIGGLLELVVTAPTGGPKDLAFTVKFDR